MATSKVDTNNGSSSNLNANIAQSKVKSLVDHVENFILICMHILTVGKYISILLNEMTVIFQKFPYFLMQKAI